MTITTNDTKPIPAPAACPPWCAYPDPEHHVGEWENYQPAEDEERWNTREQAAGAVSAADGHDMYLAGVERAQRFFPDTELLEASR